MPLSAYFHVRRDALEALGPMRFGVRGDVVFASVTDAQRVVEALRAGGEGSPVTAVTVLALAVLHELAHQALATLRAHGTFDAERALDAAFAGNAARVDEALRVYGRAFPPPPVLAGEVTIDEWFSQQIDGRSGRSWLAEELLLHDIASGNTAYDVIRPIIADDDLMAQPAYAEVRAAVQVTLRHVPVSSVPTDTGGLGRVSTLSDLLLAPLQGGGDVQAQLRHALEQWAPLLEGRSIDLEWNDFSLGSFPAGGGAIDAERLVLAIQDAAHEEHAYFQRKDANFAGGKGRELEAAPRFDDPRSANDEPLQVRESLAQDEAWEAPEKFSDDEDWMPRLVLLAKSTYVWLHQLSQRYDRAITTLDAVPDEELERIANRGFSGLWLIGIWKRSKASKRIKELTGMRDVIASAYSLDDYVIAPDLGGEAALLTLKAKAKRWGIRLAADMVPNHMGIDSSWLADHPEWFLTTKEPPFPNYQFTGENLADSPRFSVQIEDGYWDRRDAAVVFQRTDAKTGEPLYVYHGNDGTSVPWNDTAQLDFAKAEVREQLIQVIIGIAKQFPIIRFDAAMVLAKRHIQRLWYPEPGGAGGAIPSRGRHGLKKAAFDALVPEEFWREVVDRVAVEAPDTLLLAEAFWMMESYFVRSLGMHRVYNSAFLNMLEREANREFRGMIKQAIEFNPKILERYVNFINNPDEKTAAEAFGIGDKYFGAATLLATMPGLPLFGHGQFEGNREKYGMEFARPRLNEDDDAWVVARHERWIVPLLKRRDLYAEAKNFRLFDLIRPDGVVDDDVIAFANRSGRERGFVLFHNRAAHARGFIDASSPFVVAEEGLVVERLAEFLGLSRRPGRYLLFQDLESGLRYVRPVELLWSEGFRVELGPYEVRSLTGFEEVEESLAAPYGQLFRATGERGVPSIEEALMNLVSHDSAGGTHRSALLLETLFRWPLTRGLARGEIARLDAPASRAMETAFLHWVDAPAGDREARMQASRWVRTVAALKAQVSVALAKKDLLTPRETLLVTSFGGSIEGWALLAGVTAERIARRDVLVRPSVEAGWREAFEKFEVAAGEAALGAKLVAVLGELLSYATFTEAIQAFRSDRALQELLGVHEADGGIWLRSEALEGLFAWLEPAAEVLAKSRSEGVLPGSAESMPPPPRIPVQSTHVLPAELVADDGGPVDTEPLAGGLGRFRSALPELIFDVAAARLAAADAGYRYDVFSTAPRPSGVES